MSDGPFSGLASKAFTVGSSTRLGLRPVPDSLNGQSRAKGLARVPGHRRILLKNCAGTARLEMNESQEQHRVSTLFLLNSVYST